MQPLPSYVSSKYARKAMLCAPQAVLLCQLVDNCITYLLPTTLVTSSASREHYCRIVAFICDLDPNYPCYLLDCRKEVLVKKCSYSGVLLKPIWITFLHRQRTASWIWQALVYQVRFLKIFVALNSLWALKSSVQSVTIKSSSCGLYS